MILMPSWNAYLRSGWMSGWMPSWNAYLRSGWMSGWNTYLMPSRMPSWNAYLMPRFVSDIMPSFDVGYYVGYTHIGYYVEIGCRDWMSGLTENCC